MNESKKPMTLEESVRKTLLKRRLLTALGIFVFLACLSGFGYLFWLNLHEPAFVPPSYDLDPESETYWRDRTQADIDAAPKNESPARRTRVVHQRLQNTLNAARGLDSPHQRMTAITEIALTLAVNDENFNIDNTLRNLGETSFAKSLYGRILVSQSLMYIRLDNPSAARVAFQEYIRVNNEADLKLDSELNRMSFIGAVNALASLQDKGQLTEMFNRQSMFSLRIVLGQRATAFRILAGEQARVGMTIPALNTVRRIDNPVEQVRAYQLIISLTARPPKIEPVEPEITQLKTEGPWEPKLLPSVTRQVIDEVFAQIVELEGLDNQINLLLRLAGSRLMCDPEIHAIFKEAVEQYPFDELVRRPALKILVEPESDVIRAALGMPPMVRRKPLNVDPVTDDWSTPYGTVPVSLSEIAPEMVQTMNSVQTLRAWLMTAQSYLTVARYRDAGNVLRRAAAMARELSHPIDRVIYLLQIGEKQISAGRGTEARETLRAIGLPRSDGLTEAQGTLSQREVFTAERLSNLARLQTTARFFEDALETLACLDHSGQKNDDLAFLANEQIRIRRFDDAERTVSLMSPGTRTEQLKHLIALGRGGGEEQFTALDIPFPDRLNRDIDLRRVCEALFRHGLYRLAAQTADRIVDGDARMNLHRRVAREYMLLFHGYRGDNEQHRHTRQTLLREACSEAEKIENVLQRATLFESILSDALPWADDEETNAQLRTLHENTLKACRRLASDEADKAELMGKLLLAKIELETAAPDASPLTIDRQKNSALYESVMALVGETLDAVNATGDGLQRANALSSLAAALVRLDRTRDAQKMVEEARETVRSIRRPVDAVSVQLSLIPTLRRLGDDETAQKIYHSAFTLTSDSFVSSSLDAEKVYEWRVRDSELDRIVRSQLENGYLAEAVEYSVRIEENLLRERLLRTAAYIYLDQGDYVQPETILRRIKLPEIRTDTVRDVLFMKRQAEKSKPAATVEPVEEAGESHE